MAINKVINSQSQEFQPVLTDTLVLDAVPTVNSFNSVTSDAVARAVAGASGEVPAVTESDNGKILTAIYDDGGAAVEWADAPSGIPDMTSQNGKILGAVDNGGTMEAQWIDKPEVTAGDKSITVSNNAVAVNHDDTLAIATRTSAVAGLFVNNQTVRIVAGTALHTAFVNDNEITITFDNGTDMLATYTATSNPGTGTRAQLAFVSRYMGGEVSLPSPMFNITATSLPLSVLPVALDNPNSSGLSVTFKRSDLRDKNGNTITDVTTFARNGVDLCFIDSGLADTGSSGVCGKKAFTFVGDTFTPLTASATVTEPYALAVATPIPTVTGNAGKILAVNSGATGVEWVAPSSGGMTKTLIGSATNASAVSGMLNSKLTMESGVTTIPANSLVMTVFDITIDSGETLPSWEIKPFSVTVAQGEDPYDSRVTALNSLGSTLLQPQSGSLYTNNGVVWGYTTSALNVGSGYGIAFQLQHDTIQSYSVNVHLYVIS